MKFFIALNTFSNPSVLLLVSENLKDLKKSNFMQKFFKYYYIEPSIEPKISE